MSTELLLPRSTETERVQLAIQRINTAQQVVLQLTDRWIEAYSCYREARDRGFHARADRLLVELERLERASSTAEWILSLAESAHKRAIGGGK